MNPSTQPAPSPSATDGPFAPAPQDYRRRIRRAAVLGAGVMGAQIAAHLANAGIAVWLYDLPAPGGDKNAHVNKALAGLQRLKPNPMALDSVRGLIQAANYEQHLGRLGGCDLVLEAITERLDWKHELYRNVAPHLGEHSVLATNTSGISIKALAEALPQGLRGRFCGAHFFNPPRYMQLLELIPHPDTRVEVLDLLEGFLTTVLGKGVIRARDTSGFIGNRIGVFSMLSLIHHGQRHGLAPDLVDRLTGPGIGRPKSATFRTADVVGLDTLAHVVATLAQTLPEDPWQRYFRLPDWMQGLIDRGALGQKTRMGVYRKEGRDIHVFDPQRGDYRRAGRSLDGRVREILLLRDPGEKYEALLGHPHPQARFLLDCFFDLFHYCAYHLEGIAHTARDLDLALRWGYGWRQGPFETWQAIGWQRINGELAERLSRGEQMAAVPLPDWVLAPGREGVHDPQGSWSPAQARQVPRSTHPVYRRQSFPDQVLGEREPETETVFETQAVRLWHSGDDIAVLGFKTKMHTVTDAVLEGILRAIDEAERAFKALILWQREAPFCAGANLAEVLNALDAGRMDQVGAVVVRFQRASMALKHAMVPTVAAVQGLALGGGCEFLMHCDRVIAALETYTGLVEVGVGIVPAGAGSKELVIRAADEAQGGDVFPFVVRTFERVAKALVSGSAEEARRLGYLRAADAVVFNPHEVLHVAKHQGLALFEAGYRPPLRRQDIPVAGRSGAATLKAQLVNLLEGRFISEHDYAIGSRLAEILCGGEVDPGSLVDDAWLLRLEREAFMALVATEKSRQRIRHMLEQGRALRN
jgi:3-hydroxyacyl-CoA dehydrogenase